MQLIKKVVAYQLAAIDFQLTMLTFGWRMFEGYVKKWEDKIK